MANHFVSTGDDIKILSICGLCKHKNKGKATCAAFPNQIPAKFLQGKAQHTKPEQGDHNIQFEASPDADPKVLGQIPK